MEISGFLLAVCSADASDTDEQLAALLEQNEEVQVSAFRFPDLPGGLPLYAFGGIEDEEVHQTITRQFSSLLPYKLMAMEFVDTMDYQGAWLFEAGELQSGFELQHEHTELLYEQSTICKGDAIAPAFASIGQSVSSNDVEEIAVSAQEDGSVVPVYEP